MLRSLPSRERGLKLLLARLREAEEYVAPLAGAWIETGGQNMAITTYILSLPSRERGLKHCQCNERCFGVGVAPLAGAWIETYRIRRMGDRLQVAPLAGAWIETDQPALYCSITPVAPLAGAWIETRRFSLSTMALVSRSPRGSVD